jgi:virginiamycin A acetyltransferase
VGDYTYYDDPAGIESFEKNVLYLFPFLDEKLIIGKFCQIATGVRFIMNGSNHMMSGISTYPFKVMGKSWADAPMNPPFKGNTVIGNDVWIGNSATIMQGVTIGDGAIIGTNSLVTKDVPPYTIVGGNPATVIRKRFDDDTIAFLQKLAWWDWPVEKITENIHFLAIGDFESLRNL